MYSRNLNTKLQYNVVMYVKVTGITSNKGLYKTHDYRGQVEVLRDMYVRVDRRSGSAVDSKQALLRTRILRVPSPRWYNASYCKVLQ